jgi:hypothetical protein
MTKQEKKAFKIIKKYNKQRRLIKEDITTETIHMPLKDVIDMFVKFKYKNKFDEYKSH